MTTNERSNQDPHKTQWVDSLLEALYDNDKHHAQSLVTSGLERLDQQSASVVMKGQGEQGSRRSRWPRWQLVGLATAALILIAVLLPFLNPSNQAMAAVTRSIQEAIQDVGRHYTVKARIRVSDRASINREADLFVKGGDRFAIRTDTLLGSLPIWIGSNQGKAWVVPPSGPVIQGDTSSLIAWVALREEFSTPYLHIATALERIRDNYELKNLQEVSLQTSAGVITCQYIEGVLVGQGSQQVPDRIELWADSESGIALKIIAKWTLNEGEVGRESVTIELQDDIELANEFFGPNEHGGQGRRRIEFGSAANQP